MSHHTSRYISGFDGQTLYFQQWICEKPKALILFVHGYTEHSSRYKELAGYLNKQNINFLTYDQRGYGRSEGKRAYIKRFEEYLKDLQKVLKSVVPLDVPVFLMGQSMGGLIVIRYAIEQPESPVHGIIATAPALKVNDDISPILQKLSGVFSVITPQLKTVKLKTHHLSRDPEVVKAYQEDPLVYHGGTYARTGAELLKASKRIQSEFQKFNKSVLLLHGTGDQLTDPKGSKRFMEKAASEDKTLTLLEGYYHELLFEPEKEKIWKMIANWVKQRS